MTITRLSPVHPAVILHQRSTHQALIRFQAHANLMMITVSPWLCVPWCPSGAWACPRQWEPSEWIQVRPGEQLLSGAPQLCPASRSGPAGLVPGEPCVPERVVGHWNGLPRGSRNQRPWGRSKGVWMWHSGARRRWAAARLADLIRPSQPKGLAGFGIPGCPAEPARAQPREPPLAEPAPCPGKPQQMVPDYQKPSGSPARLCRELPPAAACRRGCEGGCEALGGPSAIPWRLQEDRHPPPAFQPALLGQHLLVSNVFIFHCDVCSSERPEQCSSPPPPFSWLTLLWAIYLDPQCKIFLCTISSYYSRINQDHFHVKCQQRRERERFIAKAVQRPSGPSY